MTLTPAHTVHSHHPVQRFRPTFSVVLTWMLALLPANFAPPIIERLGSDYGVPVAVAGMVVTGMTLANAATVLSVKPLVTRGHRRLLARIGITILVLSVSLGIAVPTADVVMTALVVSGVGSGLTIAVATAASAATPNPDRTSQLAIIVNRLVVAAGFLFLPLLGGSITSVFIFTAGVGLFSFFASHWLPSAPPNDEAPQSIPGSNGVGKGSIRRSSWLLALSFAAFTITEEGTYGLIQVFMTTNIPSIKPGEISGIFAAAVLAGLGGALLAPFGLRFLGRIPSMAVLLVLGTGAKLGLVFSPVLAVNIASNVVWGFTFGAIIPLVFGFAASLSRSGNSVVLVNGIYIIGVAAGPFAATQIYAAAGAFTFGLTFAILAVICGALMITAMITGRHSSSDKTHVPDDSTSSNTTEGQIP